MHVLSMFNSCGSAENSSVMKVSFMYDCLIFSCHNNCHKIIRILVVLNHQSDCTLNQEYSCLNSLVDTIDDTFERSVHVASLNYIIIYYVGPAWLF